MLPEEFSNISESGNAFEKAMYELDYGMSLKDLIVKLDDLDGAIAKEELRLKVLQSKRIELCDNIIKLSPAEYYVVQCNGEMIAAKINLDEDDVQIISTHLDESCFDEEGSDGNL
jgi:hypothetical protein